MTSPGRHKVFLIGTSTLSEILLDVGETLDIVFEGCFDDFSRAGSFHGLPILGPIEALLARARGESGLEAIVAIGDNGHRRDVFRRLWEGHVLTPNIVHTRAHVEPSASLGKGNVLLGNVYVGARTAIGDGNVFFPGVCLTHHNRVGDFNFFSPHAAVGGFTRIPSLCKIGMNSVIKADQELGDGFTCEPLTVVEGYPIARS